MKSAIVLSTLTVLLSHSAFAQSCWSTSLGYPCCKTNCEVLDTDDNGIFFLLKKKKNKN